MREYTKLEYPKTDKCLEARNRTEAPRATKAEKQERDQLFKQLKKLMETPPKPDRNREPPLCRLCPYYRPDFKYRKCIFGTCPMGKARNEPFRKRPLRGGVTAAGGGLCV